MTHYKLQLVPSLQPSFIDLVLHSVDAEKNNCFIHSSNKAKIHYFQQVRKRAAAGDVSCLNP